MRTGFIERPMQIARKDAMIADFAGFRRQQLTDGRFQFVRALARRFDAAGNGKNAQTERDCRLDRERNAG